MKALISSTILILASSLSVFTQTAETLCPEISLIAPEGMLKIEVPVKFEVKIDDKTDKSKLEFEWTASKGKITKGQGTPEVILIARFEDSRINELVPVEVSIKIKGLPKNCSNDYFSETVNIGPPISDPIEPFVHFGKSSFDGKRSTIDNFYIDINNNPTTEGLINVKFNKNESRKYKTDFLKQIVKIIEFRKYDIKRITFAISEDENAEQISTISGYKEGDILKFADENAVIIKGEDLKKSIKNLFPLK